MEEVAGSAVEGGVRYISVARLGYCSMPAFSTTLSILMPRSTEVLSLVAKACHLSAR